MKKPLLGLILLSTTAFGQQQPNPPLSVTTRVALVALAQQKARIEGELRDLQDAVSGVDKDVRKEYPGFHINPQTLGIEKDPQPPTPEVKK